MIRITSTDVLLLIALATGFLFDCQCCKCG